MGNRRSEMVSRKNENCLTGLQVFPQALVREKYLLFPIPGSLFPNSRFAIRDLLFTLYRSPFTIHHSPLTVPS
jgi:hypothetical protein